MAYRPLTLRQVCKRRKQLGYSNYSTFMNAIHLIRLGLIMKLHDITIVSDINKWKQKRRNVK